MTEILDIIFGADTFGNITVWDLRNGTTLMNYKCNAINPKCIDILGNDYVLAVEKGPLINVWPINSQERLQHIRLLCPGVINTFAVCPDSNYIAVAIENKLLIWQFATGRLLCTVTGHYQRITIVKWTKDGSDIVTGGEDGIVCVWKLSHLISTNYMYLGVSSDGNNASETKPRHTFSDHSIQITDLYIGCGGQRARLFTASADKSCKIYDLASGDQLLSLVFDTKPTCIVVDAAENTVFIGMGNGAIKTFSLLDPPRTRDYHVTDSLHKPTLVGHTKQINSLQLSIDGLHLVSASADETIKIWHVESKQCLRTIRLKGNVVNLLVRLLPKQLQKHEFQPTSVLKNFQKRYDNDASSQIMEINCPNDLSADSSSDGEHEPVANVAALHQKINELQKANRELYNFAMQNLLDTATSEPVAKKSKKKSLISKPVEPIVLKSKKKKIKKKKRKL